MSTSMEPHPDAKPEESHSQANTTFPRVPQRRETRKQPERLAFPNWSVTAIATGAIIVLLILGVTFSHHLTTLQTGGSPAPTTDRSTTGNTTSMNTAPVAVPAHQTYNPQAPATLQGET